MADRDENTRLEELDARIQALKPKVEEAPVNDDHYSQAQLGWRMVIELVAGLAIGFGIGYGLDSLFGTLPIFLVLFTMLGLAAGVNVMLRTAKELHEDYTPPGGD
ncbi:AtpZ/AtpI family protein [Alphaproteobacteria bacterium KMM 3653]|uniref:ATP synthase protein I n=1 Tax=Harenicola maris TaxID=2841044 RepID=A0AAP2CSN3_9RHOB|nr:AtpZ/AtpI family protein [Harenicola maris]